MAEVFPKLQSGGIYYFVNQTEHPTFDSYVTNVQQIMEAKPHFPDFVTKETPEKFPDHPFPSYSYEMYCIPLTDTAIVITRNPVGATALPPSSNPSADNVHRSDVPPARVSDVIKNYKSDRPGEELQIKLAPVLELTLEQIAKHDKCGLLVHVVEAHLHGMKNTRFTSESYNVFKNGDNLRGLGATISVPVANDKWIAAAKIIQERVHALAEKKVYQTGPVHIRFVRGSAGIHKDGRAIPLGESEDVCKFEFLYGGAAQLIVDLLTVAITDIYAALWAKFPNEVRFHWGQFIPPESLDRSKVEGSFKHWQTWKGIQEQYDPNHQGVNEFLKNFYSRL